MESYENFLVIKSFKKGFKPFKSKALNVLYYVCVSVVAVGNASFSDYDGYNFAMQKYESGEIVQKPNTIDYTALGRLEKKLRGK